MSKTNPTPESLLISRVRHALAPQEGINSIGISPNGTHIPRPCDACGEDAAAYELNGDWSCTKCWCNWLETLRVLWQTAKPQRM